MKQSNLFLRALRCRGAPIFGGIVALALLAAPNPAAAEHCEPDSDIAGETA